MQSTKAGQSDENDNIYFIQLWNDFQTTNISTNSNIYADTFNSLFYGCINFKPRNGSLLRRSIGIVHVLSDSWAVRNCTCPPQKQGKESANSATFHDIIETSQTPYHRATAGKRKAAHAANLTRSPYERQLQKEKAKKRPKDKPSATATKRAKT